VRLGINLGPVRLVRDANGQPNIIGDGINVAERVISFARPGQVLVSRAYYEMVTRNCADYAAQFSYQGSRTDRHVREHEIFEVAVAPAQALEVAAHRHHVRVEQQAGRDNATERTQPPRARSTSRWLAHRGFAYGAVAVSSALLVAAIAFYTLDSGPSQPVAKLAPAPQPTVTQPSLSPVDQPEAPVATAAAPAQPAAPAEAPVAQTTPEPTRRAPRVASAPRSGAAKAPAVATRAPPGAVSSSESATPTPEAAAWKPVAAPADKAVAMAPAAQPAAQPAPAGPTAFVSLAISPWGEVLVNGKPMGVSPPMSELQLSPGSHRIEIRNGNSKPHLQTIELGPNQTIRIRHKFSQR